MPVAFWRRGQAQQTERHPDPEFDFLTDEQGARLRDLARVAFAEAGVETVGIDAGIAGGLVPHGLYLARGAAAIRPPLE